MTAVRPVLPVLRALARRLTGNGPDGDDLVQDTLVRAWRAREQFEPGTNLKAWMIRIERNSFLTGRRRSGREVELDPDALDRRMVQAPSQEEPLHLGDLDRALGTLPRAQREAFLGISGGGRYRHVAAQLGISEGTLKSRVARARAALVESLESGVAPVPARAPVPAAPIAPTARYDAWKRAGSRMIG